MPRFVAAEGPSPQVSMGPIRIDLAIESLLSLNAMVSFAAMKHVACVSLGVSLWNPEARDNEGIRDGFLSG